MKPSEKGLLDGRCDEPLIRALPQDCLVASPFGATYRLRASNLGEWLSDFDCDGPGHSVRMAIALAGDDALGITHIQHDVGVRCVFATQPPARAADTAVHDERKRP